MRIVVFGAGAVGSVLGAALVRSGVSVELIGRPSHVLAVRERGLSVEGLPGGPFRPAASERLGSDGPIDALVLSVKTYDLRSAARAIAAARPSPVPILAVQNGIGILPLLNRALEGAGWVDPVHWTTRAVLTMGATFLGPGSVRLAGTGELVLGAPSSAEPPGGYERLFRTAGLSVEVRPSIEREEWRKALVNAAINPVTADHGVLNGALLDDPWRGQALALLEEARRVAAAEGFDLPEEEAERELFRVVRATRENRSSMRQDVDAGRPTEIEAISGEILRRGEARGWSLLRTRRAVERIRARSATAPARPD